MTIQLLERVTKMFKRISKRQAKKMFEENKSFSLCPCKMNPSYPFSMACKINPTDWKEHCENIGVTDPFESMYSNWAYYNTSWETRYYAHYYIEK